MQNLMAGSLGRGRKTREGRDEEGREGRGWKESREEETGSERKGILKDSDP